MCGRFALAIPRRLVSEALVLPGIPDAPARFNIAPTQLVEAVSADRHITRRVAGLFRWGLVPSWAKDPKIDAKMINARSETVFDKPSFRSAIRYRRCLIPAQGFFEWQHLQAGNKAPYFITSAAVGVMVLAGIFEHWNGPEGETIDSLAILTREASGVVRLLHDRQPVILPTALHAAWIDPLCTTRQDIQDILDTPPPTLAAVPVGTLINNPHNEGPELITPIGPPLVAE